MKYGIPPTAIETRMGNWVNLEWPERCTIFIEDIAYALSNLCRYTGHTRGFYSVAQHSVLCAKAWAQRHPDDHLFQLAVLLHDAPEAYLGDVSRPLKTMLSHYKTIERRMASVIESRYGLRQGDLEDSLVKDIDNRMLLTEARDLGFSPFKENASRDVLHAWGLEGTSHDLTPYSQPIIPWPPVVAKHAFLTRFKGVYTLAHGKAPSMEIECPTQT